MATKDWLEATQKLECGVPHAVCGAGWVEKYWDYYMSNAFFEGGPGFTVWGSDKSVSFYPGDTVDDFNREFGAAWTVAITPAYDGYDVEKVYVLVNEPFVDVEIVSSYDDATDDEKLMELALRIANRTPAYEGEVYELGFVNSEFARGWALLYAMPV